MLLLPIPAIPASFKGIEGTLSILGPRGTTWNLGGTLMSADAEESRGFRSKSALRPLLERFTGGVTRSFPGGLTLGLHAQRSRRSGEDAYHRINLKVGLQIGRGQLYLDATNLTGEAYPDITGARAPGRALFLGVELGPGG